MFTAQRYLLTTLKDLMIAIEEFEKMINENYAQCIKKIVRKKNGFASIDDESWNMDLFLFDYKDVKLNIIVEHQGMRLIGEIQFIPKFMLEAKKKGHSVYGFVRKHDYFSKLSQLIKNSNNDEKYNLNRMLRIILSQNMLQFSSFFQNWNQTDKQFVLKYKNEIYSSLESNQWKQGLKFFTNATKDLK